jgi:hypothetical protein
MKTQRLQTLLVEKAGKNKKWQSSTRANTEMEKGTPKHTRVQDDSAKANRGFSRRFVAKGKKFRRLSV